MHGPVPDHMGILGGSQLPCFVKQSSAEFEAMKPDAEGFTKAPRHRRGDLLR